LQPITCLINNKAKGLKKRPEKSPINFLVINHQDSKILLTGSKAHSADLDDGIRIGIQAGGFNIQDNQGEHGMDYTLTF
jgi:hypothetical protein